jgi:hypothetical protein
MLDHQPLPLGGEPRDACFLDVIRRHLHEFGLRRRAGFGAAGEQQIRQFVVRLQPARLGLKRRTRDTCLLGIRPQRGNELRERSIGGNSRGRADD